MTLKNIKVPMSEKLKNFKLIGEIKRGQLQRFHQRVILEEIIFSIYLLKKTKIQIKNI